MRSYGDLLTAETNAKGVLDIDPIKGCYYGMKKYSKGCYDLCYANKIATMRGLNFKESIIRHIRSTTQLREIAKEIHRNKLPFIRMGTFGDPCYSWEHTLRVAAFVKSCSKKIVVITKHWILMTDKQLEKAGKIGIVLNTSISALDQPDEIKHRFKEYVRYKAKGVSCLRIVSCKFNKNHPDGKRLNSIQDSLFENENIIDNPLRVNSGWDLANKNIAIMEKRNDLNTKVWMSVRDKSVYTGHCDRCKELCGLIYERI